MAITKENPKEKRSHRSKVSRGRQGQATAFRDEADVLRLIEAMPEDWARLAATLAYYGCGRIDAVLHLKAEDIRNEKIRYRAEHAKTDTYHELKQFRSLREALTQYDLPATGYLFPAQGRGGRKQYRQHWVVDEPDAIANATEKGWRQSNTRKYVRSAKAWKIRFNETLAERQTVAVRSQFAFAKALKEAAEALINQGYAQYYGVSSHTFRRSMCSRLYFVEGWTLAAIMKVSGHRSLDALQKYLQVDASELAERFEEI